MELIEPGRGSVGQEAKYDVGMGTSRRESQGGPQGAKRHERDLSEDPRKPDREIKGKVRNREEARRGKNEGETRSHDKKLPAEATRTPEDNGDRE